LSWAKSLYDTYCACESSIGKCTDDSQAKMLLPVGHILIKPKYIITIREDGSLFGVEIAISRGQGAKFYVAAPCTDDSAGRSSTGAHNFPHPLFDQMKFLLGPVYKENLAKWIRFLSDKTEYSFAHRVLTAVYSYIMSGTLKSDIPEAKDKDAICFCVNITGNNENRLWRMPELWQAWFDYQEAVLPNNYKTDICYIAGEALPYTEKHPKAINRNAGNAKLISGNDNENFTFRGRFIESSQAVTVSYIASQKVHQALRWLIATRGMCCDTQVILAWAIDKETAIEDPLEDSLNIYESAPGKQTSAAGITDLDYGFTLRQVLLGSGNVDRLKEHKRRIALIALDAATTGRLSITYYRELSEDEYHERIVNWHEQCRWCQPLESKQNEKSKPNYFIGAPSARRIVKAILGKKPAGGSESYDKLEKRIRERLLHCIIDGEHVPIDVLNTVLNRASNPLGMENKDAKNYSHRWLDWEVILGVACGLWRRHYIEKGDEYKLALDENRTDRDYLYGRLLAVADKLEQYALNQDEKKRPTTAIRYMRVFAQKPYSTWKAIKEHLLVYIMKLGGKAAWYQSLLDEIGSKFEDRDFETNTPLKGAYLLGYYCQRKAIDDQIALWAEKNKNKEENQNESLE
jgi:CRISPR-associated protein Csd1